MALIDELLNLDTLPSVVDVGANPIDGDPPYKKLLDLGLCRVTGFEPQVEALAELHRMAGDLETYLPYALGNGSPITLNICAGTGMTSALAPDFNTLSLFTRLERLAHVERQVTVDTVRLDDIAEIDHIDFLKIDVQGYELEIIKNGTKKLKDCSVIQLEVSFTALYENQPIFGDIDLYLRSVGFVPHCFAALKNWPITPCVINGNDATPLNQLLEADAVYVRDFTARTTASDRQLKNMALVGHYCYGSFDLTMRCLQRLEGRGAVSAGSLQAYVNGFGAA